MPTSLFNRGSDLDPITSGLILKALDGLATRQLYTSQNIANANSPGYQPVEVSFEGALREAARGGPGAIAGVRPEVHASTRPSEGGVRIDLELASAAQTAMRYSGLIEIYGRQVALNKAALSWGGR